MRKKSTKSPQKIEKLHTLHQSPLRVLISQKRRRKQKTLFIISAKLRIYKKYS